MINLTRLKNLALSYKMRIKSTILSKKPRSRIPKVRKSEKKSRKRDTRNNKTGEKDKTVAPLQLELILFRLQKAKKIRDMMT